jgi:16S rRNA (guanine527-N7)-methyltransferase
MAVFYFTLRQIKNHFLKAEIILKYFPELSQSQVERFEMLGTLYSEWNQKINVISRQDIENLYEHHILHSLGIAKVIRFKAGTMVLDAGTGGGFPGIPLAILFPEVRFHLIDSTAKKISVVNAITDETGLKNITTGHQRMEEHRATYDFVISRAVASLSQMMSWISKNISGKGFNELGNGLLYLKGGDLSEELKEVKVAMQEGTEVGKLRSKMIDYQIFELSKHYEEPYFETKKVIHLF